MLDRYRFGGRFHYYGLRIRVFILNKKIPLAGASRFQGGSPF